MADVVARRVDLYDATELELLSLNQSVRVAEFYLLTTRDSRVVHGRFNAFEVAAFIPQDQREREGTIETRGVAR